MSDLDFAALLCSRLCHDLVSPVGAINNGLEILEEEKDEAMREAVVDLITKSTQQTANKLQFFRLAFGAAGGFSDHLDMREAEKAVTALLSGSRVELEWRTSVASGSKSLVKLLLNMCLVVSECLIRGGRLSVNLSDEGDQLILSVQAEGQRIILQDAVKQGLMGRLDNDQLEPRNAPAFLAACIVKEFGSQFELDVSNDTHLSVKAAIKPTN